MSQPRPTLRRRPLVGPFLMASLFALGATVAAHDADAKNDMWPPPESATAADLADPSLWPDDPSWGYNASGNAKEHKKGLWYLYGFQPDRAPNAPPLRPEELGKPSGMSLDLAWRYTQGDPAVIVSILDSGPKWDDGDLRTKAYLNVGELVNHKPKDASGAACGGAGALAGFDCNGNGILDVDDYADDPGLLPAATEEGGKTFPRGDRNHNGQLDAGDLILNFTDGIDDDGNGYVDDISGWDFLMGDNDPYEDTRFYHGTNQARHAVAGANDGMGGVGTCPNCRFVPLRVGDSFIADAQAFALATTYSADNGVSVIECALGTVDMTSFAMSAVEYAWNKGLLVVASMADENSKHQNVPNTTNYTLQVHAILNNGTDADATKAKSMTVFDPGTNYGGNNYLSASSEDASSGAAAVTSGVAGLVLSAARKYGSAPLAPGELFQLLTMTADDVDMPESQLENAQYYWSQKGFDQRFGYGRVNANTAVEWVKAGRIPPEVNVTAPYWFENIYVDRITGPVEVRGTVSAKRAASYDYVVEWGPGVQPLDTEFKQITQVQNVAGTVVSGADAPIAQLDMATIDPTHTRDKDSPDGENDRAFTVRIRATAHYGDPVGDVPGEIRRTYYAHKDPDLLDGFPLRLKASGESSPKLADLDGDGKKDIIIADADGNVHAFATSPTPHELPGFPFRVKRLDGLEGTPLTPGTTSYLNAPAYASGALDPDQAREAIFATVAVGDLDGDGRLEIVATTFSGTLYVVGHDGQVRPGWPVRLPLVPSCPLDPATPRPEVCMDPQNIIVRGAAASPVLADMNKDGALDIVQAGMDGKVYVFDAGGQPLAGWPVQVHFPQDIVPDVEHNRIMTTPAVADVDGDGIPEVLVGSSEQIMDSVGAFYLIDGRGTAAGGPRPELPGVKAGWPVSMSSLDILPMLGEGVTNAPVFADVDGDGSPDGVMHGNVSAPIILPADPGGQKTLGSTPNNALPQTTDANGNPRRGLAPTSAFGDLSKAHADTMFPLFAQPSIGDLDMDGTPDIIASGGSLSLAGNLVSKGNPSAKPAQFMLGMWSGKTGAMFPGAPVLLEDFTFVNSQVIADITGDGVPEVLTGTAVYHLRAVDACGREAPGFPKNTGQWIMETPAIGDLDGDGKLEVVVGTRNGWLYAWRTEGKADGVVQWESFHHDNHNSGNYAVKLDQGVPFKAGVVLDCDASTQGNAGAAGSSGAAGAAGGPAADAPAEGSDDGGCGCRAAGLPLEGGAGRLGALGWLAALALGLRRRRAA
jgi:hypothetical protein